MSALFKLHLHSRLDTWLQYTAQRQLQAETKNIEVSRFGAAYIRDLTVFWQYIVSLFNTIARDRTWGHISADIGWNTLNFRNKQPYRRICVGLTRIYGQIAKFMGQHGAHLGPVGPIWAPCWPKKTCFQGGVIITPAVIKQNSAGGYFTSH